jgi:uncharacterized membrane protein
MPTHLLASVEAGMPLHVIAGHLAIVTAPIAALVALVYALVPRVRPRARWPLLAATAVNCALALWASTTGSELYEALGAAPGTTAHDHAKASEGLAVASLVLLVVAAVLAFWRGAPRRPTAGVVHVATVAALALGAVAVAATTVGTVAPALASVWSHHEIWSAR